jgi:hypothetical protein
MWKRERRRKRRLMEWIDSLEDPDLIQAAQDQFAATYDADETISRHLRDQVEAWIDEAAGQRESQVVLEPFARSRLRSFLYNERLRLGDLS